MPSVVSATLTPTISPKVKSELTSGLPNSDCGGGLMVEVQRLRIVGQRRDQDIVGLGDGAGDGMGDAVADLPLVEIAPGHGSALGAADQPPCQATAMLVAGQPAFEVAHADALDGVRPDRSSG